MHGFAKEIRFENFSPTIFSILAIILFHEYLSFVSTSEAHVEEVFECAHARENDLKNVVRELVKDMDS